MDDLISKKAAIDALNKLSESTYEANYGVVDCDDAINAIATLPPTEPKRGRWISADAMFGGVPFYCSECGENTRDTVMGEPRWNFCPNCGCRMGGGEQ